MRPKVSHIMNNVIIKSCLIYKLNKERKYDTYMKGKISFEPKITW